MLHPITTGLACALLLSSCVLETSGLSSITRYDKVQLLRPGMTGEDVQEILGGQPTAIELPGPQGPAAWTYTYRWKLGLALGVVLFASEDVHTISIVLDEAGKVLRIEGAPLRPAEYRESAWQIFRMLELARRDGRAVLVQIYTQRLREMGFDVRPVSAGADGGPQREPQQE